MRQGEGEEERGLGAAEMGFMDKLVSVLGLKKREANVLVVGLDNSGALLLLSILLFLLLFYSYSFFSLVLALAKQAHLY